MPKRQCAAQDHVDSHRASCVVLGVIEADLVVPQEAEGGDEEGAIAEGEADVLEVEGLLEFEGVDVVCEGVVGGVFEVWELN